MRSNQQNISPIWKCLRRIMKHYLLYNYISYLKLVKNLSTHLVSKNLKFEGKKRCAMRSNWQNVSVTNTGDDCEGTIFEASAASLRSPSSSGSWWSHSSKLFLAKRGRPRLKQNLVCCFLKVNKKGFSKFSSQESSLSNDKPP